MAKKVAIIGYGVEGQASYRYWHDLGAEITILDADENAKVPTGVKSVLGPKYLANLDGYDLIVRSPGTKPWLINSKAPVTSAINEFFAQCPARIIGVTGSKGKGTTTTLISRILGEAGWRTHVGGNIGKPVLDFLGKVRASHLVVLELSSFQLMDLAVSPHIGVCLMIVPEHLDWHRSMHEYVAAKGNIFWHQGPDDVAVYNGRNAYATEIAQLSVGHKLPYLEQPGALVNGERIEIGGTEICRVDEVGLIGPHNLENVCAAVTATWDLVKRNPDPVRRAVKAFTGLDHRLEFVREVGGVRYFDDSFSTNPESAMAAIKSFEQPKILILGGSEKNSDYNELARAVAKSDVRYCILIGDTAPKIKAALDKAGYIKTLLGPRTMAEIMGSVQAVVRPGDVVLLSPAAASFGLFANYKDRGEQFKAAVKVLKG